MKMNLIFSILLIAFFKISVNAQKMNNKKLEKIIVANADSIEGDLGYWQFKYQRVWMVAVTDEAHNRMRIITPIVKVEELDQESLEAALAANFHSVLDAKYAISEGLMWSTFIHPLKELTEEQVESALQQLYYSSLTFGTDYSGGELVFPSSE